MKWYPARMKPNSHIPILIALAGNEYASGHYEADTDRWLGKYQSSFYEIEPGMVTHWCLIEPPTWVDSAKLVGEYFNNLPADVREKIQVILEEELRRQAGLDSGGGGR